MHGGLVSNPETACLRMYVLEWRGMWCIKSCESTLDPVRGNRMAPAITCSTESSPPLAVVGEGSIKSCLILGIVGQKLGW